MEAPKLLWGAADWLAVAATLAAVLLALLVIAYWRAGATRGVRLIAATLKAVAILILALCLLEPLLGGARARPGANQFVVLADNSQSMTLKDGGSAGNGTRGQSLKLFAAKAAPWLARLGRDFDLREYAFDSQLKSVDDFES